MVLPHLLLQMEVWQSRSLRGGIIVMQESFCGLRNLVFPYREYAESGQILIEAALRHVLDAGEVAGWRKQRGCSSIIIVPTFRRAPLFLINYK